VPEARRGAPAPSPELIGLYIADLAAPKGQLAGKVSSLSAIRPL